MAVNCIGPDETLETLVQTLYIAWTKTVYITHTVYITFTQNITFTHNITFTVYITETVYFTLRVYYCPYPNTFPCHESLIERLRRFSAELGNLASIFLNKTLNLHLSKADDIYKAPMIGWEP